jgi:hypothetical protein
MAPQAPAPQRRSALLNFWFCRTVEFLLAARSSSVCVGGVLVSTASRVLFFNRTEHGMILSNSMFL